MPLGVKVGLGPGHIVVDGDPAPLPEKGAQPPIFGPCLLWPNGWMDQDATWYHGGRPRPRPQCARWGPSFPPKQPPIFGRYLLWPNGWINQDATWYKGRRQRRPHCITWGSSSPKRGTAPQFSAHVYCGQMVAHLSYC